MKFKIYLVIEISKNFYTSDIEEIKNEKLKVFLEEIQCFNEQEKNKIMKLNFNTKKKLLEQIKFSLV